MSYNQMMNEVMQDTPHLPEATVSVVTQLLTEDDRVEVIAFLAERPIHTVAMAGLIRDNGIVSEDNRGSFWGCRNSEGRLEGVALIGHATLIEARSKRAIQDFALTAQLSQHKHMIMGELERVEEFWNYYADEGQTMRLACRELLFELRNPVQSRQELDGLRLATNDDLEQILPVHAAMAEAESGVNPLNVDPEGFRERCRRRIERGRVWVLTKDGRLIFKVDVQSDTPDVIYLEGVYVQPGHRGEGIGRQCLAQISRRLLTRTGCICLLANEENERAQSLYRMAGFKLRGVYDTIFLDQNMN
jgi:predicted GNAT family acetyltransferase